MPLCIIPPGLEHLPASLHYSEASFFKASVRALPIQSILTPFSTVIQKMPPLCFTLLSEIYLYNDHVSLSVRHRAEFVFNQVPGKISFLLTVNIQYIFVSVINDSDRQDLDSRV